MECQKICQIILPEDMPDRMPDGMPEDMPEHMPEDMPEDMPEHLPEDMPEHLPEDMPGRMPEDMPDRMPDRMPENMSDRMPEDLPVTKCINVMVGITRSKVIDVKALTFRTEECGHCMEDLRGKGPDPRYQLK